jgi:probable F420-dependent oxidoreductase
MRLGIHLPQFREPVPGRVLAEAARAAEEAGADDLWVSDHLILPVGSTRPPESFHDPLTVLTWAAAVTRRAGLGTSVLVAPYRHPVVLAKALASLDALSGGRVILGVGAGWMVQEFAAVGAPFRERGARTDEAIRACRALWSGADTFESANVRVRGMRLLPAPARPGGPPVWVGGDSDAGIRRAARLGDAWHTTTSDPARLAGRIEVLDAALREAGRSRAEVVLSVRVRAGAERMAGLAPRLRELGVDHVLVDPPAFDPDRFPDEVAALRRTVDAAAGAGG